MTVYRFQASPPNPIKTAMLLELDERIKKLRERVDAGSEEAWVELQFALGLRDGFEGKEPQR